MTADRDTTRIVRQWLEDGADVLPDRVLDTVLDRLPATPQRRHWWQAWRNPFVMNTMRLALTAGVVVVATFVGVGLYFNLGDLVAPPQPTPTSSPSPTIEPTPAESPRSALQISHGRDAPAGTYVTSSPFPIQIEFTIPGGWQMFHVADDAVGVMKNGGEPPTGSGFGFWLVHEVYLDPCDARLRGSAYVGPSVDHLANALQGLEGYRTTTPTDVSLAGYSGKYLEITAPGDLSGCAFVRLWRTKAGGNRSVFGPEEHDRIWILDVEGTRLLVKIAYRPGTPESDVAELEQMVESIRIRAPEGPTPTADQASAASAMSFSRIGGNVPAGTYVTDHLFPVQVQFTVPDGWRSHGFGSDAGGVDRYGGESAHSGFEFWIIEGIYEDPCGAGAGLQDRINPGPTVDDLASGLHGLEYFETTDPTEASLGGFSGKYIELTAPADPGACGDLGLRPSLWMTSSHKATTASPGEHYRMWILDVEGTRLVIYTYYGPESPESDVAELQQMVDSIVIQP